MAKPLIGAQTIIFGTKYDLEKDADILLVVQDQASGDPIDDMIQSRKYLKDTFGL